MKHLTGLIVLLACTLASAAIELPKRECFGRLEYSLPENVELALAEEYIITNGEYPEENVAIFENQMTSYWSKMKYDKFKIYTTTDKLERTPEVIRSRYFSRGKERHKYFYGNSITKQIIEYGKLVKWFGENKTKAFGRSTPTSIDFVIYDKNFYYFLKNIDDTKDFYEENDRLPLVADYKQIAENFRRRELNEIPTEVGTCIPYGFIRDDGQVPLNFQTTFRLRDHPDVDVTITEETERGRKTAGIAQDNVWNTLTWYNNAFYEGRYYWSKDISLGFIFNRYHGISMNGKQGMWSRAKYTAPNGSKNMTFVAIVLGDQNNPHIEVAVAQHTSLAKDKPLSEDEVIDLGKRIAESVRVRPTSNAPTPPYPNYFEPVQ